MNVVWQLRGTSDSGSVELQFGAGVHVLGSATDCDLIIADRTISRRHARIVAGESGVSIEDLASTNGTTVDGKTVDSPTDINKDSEIKLGHVFLHISVVAEHDGEEQLEESDISGGQSLLLGPATVGFLRDAGQEVSFSSGEVVVRRGERQEFFFVVIEGEVELFLSEDEDRGRPLARLGEGGIFGAESVLGKGGAATGAVAVTDVRLLRYPAHALPTALQESASLRSKLLGGFARNLQKTTSDALDLMRGNEVMARLVQGDNDPDALIAVSPRMKAIRRKIDALSKSRDAVLIAGEDGTGKTLAARLIHDASERSSGPLIAVNCRDLRSGHAAELILGEDLGGRLPTGRRGSGGIHLAHNGTLVLRGADELEAAVQQMLAAYIATAKGKPPGSYPDTRFVLTTRSASSADGGPTAALAETVDEIIEIPPLAKRPKDIIPLAEEFLSRTGPPAPTITEDAQHALLSLRYQRRNVAELREVLGLASRLADGPEIRAEHIFGGVGDDDTAPGLSITDTPLIRRLLRPLGIPLARALTFAGFAAVIVLCLGFASTTAGRVANTAIWSVWEPAVFGLFFLIGPVWCTICPLSTAARLSKKLGWPEQSPPPWIIRHGPWLTIVGFALIVWVERFFESTMNPVASGFLLASLVAAAVIFGVLYKREVWCRYLCPLGRLATVLAPASPLQIKAKPTVCASTCTTHECYKGTIKIPGCTVFHHPLEGKQAYRCKLCGDCLNNCTHHSAQLQVRAPLMSVWRLDSSAQDLALFGLAISILALALVASRSFEALATPLAFTVLCVLSLVAGIALHHVVMAIAHTDRRIAIMVRLAVALMILGWSTLMVSQLANIVVLDKAEIVLPAVDWLPLWIPLRFSLLKGLQITFVLFGLTLATIALSHIRFEGTSIWTRIGRFLTPLVLIGYAASVVLLILF